MRKLVLATLTVRCLCLRAHCGCGLWLWLGCKGYLEPEAEGVRETRRTACDHGLLLKLAQGAVPISSPALGRRHIRQRTAEVSPRRGKSLPQPSSRSRNLARDCTPHRHGPMSWELSPVAICRHEISRRTRTPPPSSFPGSQHAYRRLASTCTVERSGSGMAGVDVALRRN